MLERATYTNHKGDRIEFGDGSGIYLNESALHDHSWTPVEVGGAISYFERGNLERELPVRICVEDGGIALRNRLFEVCEADVLAGKRGRLWIGDYYLECFVTGAGHERYLADDGYIRTSLRLVSDIPFWTRETVASFRKRGSGIGGRRLDFPYDHPYDFKEPHSAPSFENEALAATRFLLRIYGPAATPYVYIGGGLRRVNVQIDTGEILEIESRRNRITKYSRTGMATNCLNLRDKDVDVFARIPTGHVTVSSDGSFAFDMVAYDERSMPPWQPTMRY